MDDWKNGYVNLRTEGRIGRGIDRMVNLEKLKNGWIDGWKNQ